MYQNVPNMNYQQFYQPPTKICHQQFIQNVPPKTWCTYQQNMNVNISYCPTQQFGGRVLLQPVWVVHPPYHHPLNTPNKMVTVTYVHMMTVEQTANWIRTLCMYKGWKEALAYETRFRKNKINGEMLGHLNHEILRFDIGISNHTHRLVLMTVIRQLFPFLNKRLVISEPKRLSDLRQTKTICNRRQETSSSQMTGNFPHKDKPFILQPVVPTSDESSGMDLTSVQNNSNKSVSTKSGSDLDVSESKSSCSRISKPSPYDLKLTKNGNYASYTIKQTSSFGKASPMQKSFGDIKEPRKSERHCPSGVQTTTECPVRSRDTVICDKSFQGQFLGTTDEGEVVTISNIKGHKTIVVHKRGAFCKSGAKGWVSLDSEEGISLLQELSKRE